MTEDFLIGTYTDTTSKGLYAITLDTDKQQLVNLRLIVAMQKPSYLALGDHGRMYILKQDGDRGGVASFQLEGEHAKELDDCMAAGSPPAYISLDKKRGLVYSANYHKGEVKSYKIGPHGELTLADTVKHEGQTGPKPEQEAPHAHYVELTPDGRIAVCDLGLDLLITYDVDDDGKMTAVSRHKCEAGFGPRHLDFHPNGQYAYLLGELGSKLEVLKYNANDGSFTHLQTVKTIPADWKTHNGAAAIHVTQDGKFVYTSNRGENTIAVWAIQPDFTVKHVQSISTEGSFPRDFELSAGDKYLLAANALSDNMSLYSRDPESGKLTLLQKDVAVPKAVCVKKWPH